MLIRIAAVTLVALTFAGCQSTDHESYDMSNMDMEAAMATYMANAEPGAGHAVLEPMIGTFKATMSMVTAPGAPPEISHGTCTNAWILGGRYVATNFESEVMGQSFSGRGFMGYDNATNEYVAVWMDSMSTGMAPIARGTASPDGKTIVVSMTAPDPMTGVPSLMREVTTIHSNDRHTFEMFQTPLGGTEALSFSIEYERM